MNDLLKAVEEAKSLPEEALRREAASPSGMIPGYVLMSEIAERQGLHRRQAPKSTVVQDLVQSFSEGGLIRKLNPFIAMVEGMGDPQAAGAGMQDRINSMFGGQPPLFAPQVPQAASAAPHLSDLRPPPPGTPQEPPRYNQGGIIDLLRT